ncbi:TPA: hypothetical protein QDB51_003484 [Burkholderia vietnamiensis]|nr:hypothetical protein [Burkholderia vietnamiensis]
MDKEVILKEVEESSNFKRIKPLRPSYKKNLPEKSTINRVHAAIKQLEDQELKATTTSIGELIGISKQRVHQILQHSNELYLLANKSRKIKMELIALALKDFDTSHLSISEIHELPINGIKEISPQNLSSLLKKNNIPHSYSKSKEERLAGIDTSEYTFKELLNMVGGSKVVLRQFLYEHRIPFKDKRFRIEKSTLDAILQKLKGMDTAQYTINELHKLIGTELKLVNFKQFIYKNKNNIPYKRESSRAHLRKAGLPKIERALQELNIDSSQYTMRELHALIGTGRTLKSFRSDISKRKIPFKKSRERILRNTPIILEKLSQIDTQSHTISSLAEMIGITRQTLSKIVAEHNIPVYKDRRSKEEMAPFWEKLHSVDTTQYTSDELLAFLDHKVGKKVMLKHLAKRGMKYKLLVNRNKI